MVKLSIRPKTDKPARAVRLRTHHGDTRRGVALTRPRAMDAVTVCEEERQELLGPCRQRDDERDGVNPPRRHAVGPDVRPQHRTRWRHFRQCLATTTANECRGSSGAVVPGSHLGSPGPGAGDDTRENRRDDPAHAAGRRVARVSRKARGAPCGGGGIDAAQRTGRRAPAHACRKARRSRIMCFWKVQPISTPATPRSGPSA